MSIRLRVVLAYNDENYRDEIVSSRNPSTSFQSQANTSNTSFNTSHSFIKSPSSLREYKRFLHVTERASSLQQVCLEILQRYIKLYPNEGYDTLFLFF